MVTRVLALLGIAFLLSACHEPRSEDSIPQSELMTIVIVPGPPELSFEEKLAQRGVTDKGPIDLSQMVWPTQQVSFYSESPVSAPPVNHPQLAQARPTEQPKKPLQGPVRAEESIPHYAEAHEDEERLRGYKFAKRLGAMDIRYCRGESLSFVQGCIDGMNDDAAEFHRDYR